MKDGSGFHADSSQHLEPDMDILKLAKRFVRKRRRRYPVL